MLDPILEAYVEEDLGREQLVAPRAAEPTTSSASSGWSTAPSTSAARRRPGIKITTKAFGRDRRLPITNRYRG